VVSSVLTKDDVDVDGGGGGGCMPHLDFRLDVLAPSSSSSLILSSTFSCSYFFEWEKKTFSEGAGKKI
jgi:hypothetical protein